MTTVPLPNFARPFVFLSLASAMLMSCQDDGGVAVLTVTGAFEPAAIDFGEVPVGMNKAIPVVLKNTGRPALKIDSVEVPANFTLRGLKGLLEGRTMASGETVDFEVLYFPEQEEVRNEQIRVISDEVVITLDITASGVIRAVPVLTLVPNMLDFGTVAVNTTQQASVTVQNTGTADGVLSRAVLMSSGVDIRAGDPYLTSSLPLTIPAGGSAQLDVVFTPQQSIQYNDVMYLHTPDDSHAPLELLLGGTGLTPAGNVVCNPSLLAFGPVERGTVATRSVSCSAMGGPVRLIGATTSSSMFRLPTPVANADLMAGSSVSIDVDFHPEGLPRQVSETLVIDYNGASGVQQAVVTLSGEVIPPPPDVTALTAILTWNTNQHDVDIHLVRGGGSTFSNDDCYYANLSPDWGVANDQTDNPFLDVDDLDGFGPETINLGASAPGTYEVWVHFYSSDILNRPTEASVEVYLAGTLAGTFRRPNFTCNQLWQVGVVTWDGMNGTFNPTNTVQMSSRGACF
ncbi:MAG: choice-of-anchor D domain-containing protein [Deltaproteobacteria bacterium]